MQEPTAEVEVTVNGERRSLPAGWSLATLIEHLGVRGRFAVERNAEIVPRSRLATTVIEDGDRIEVVQAIGGGLGPV